MAPKTTQRKGVAQPVKPTKAQSAPEAKEGYSTWKNDDLKDELRARNATVGGKKADLVARLEELDAQGVTSDNPLEKKTPAKKSTGTKSSSTKPAPAKTTGGDTGAGKGAAPRKVDAPRKSHGGTTDGPRKVDAPRKVHGDTKDGPKKKPLNAHETGNKTRKPSRSKSPLSTTIGGGVEKSIKATAAEKDRANRFRDRLTKIMKKMRDNHGGGTAGVLGSVFSDTYDDLLNALNNLSKIQEAELKEEEAAAKKVESEAEAEVEAEAEAEEPGESEEEGEAPEGSQSSGENHEVESDFDPEE